MSSRQHAPSPRVFRCDRTIFTAIFLALVAAGGSETAHAENWPQFRGSSANAITSKTLPLTWAENGDEATNIRWKISLAGEGWSQPVIWNQQIFLTAAVPQPSADQSAAPETRPEQNNGGYGRDRDDLTEVVYKYETFCLDADSGKELWRTTCKEGRPPIPRHSTNTYATETPITDGNLVYAYFGMNGVFALDMQGNMVWQKDLGVYEMRANWGTASSPTLHDGRLYVQVDNQVDSFLVALDAKTGEELWRVARDEKSQYSSPMIWQNSQRSELIVGGMIYRSHDPGTGELLWELDMAKGRSSATPVADGDRLYIGTELKNRGGDDDGGGRLFCVTPGGQGDITPPDDQSQTDFVAWWIEGADLQMASPTVCDNKLYLFERRTGNMHCVDANTGDTVYRKRVRGAKAFWASPWTDGNHVYALDGNGTTHVLGSGDDYELVASNDLDQQTWGTPALADGRIYLRTVEHLYCIEDLTPETTP